MKKLILLILLSVAVWGDGYFYNRDGYSFYANSWDNFYETSGMTDSEVKEWGKQTIQGIVKECLNGNIESCNKYSTIYARRSRAIDSLLTVKSNLKLLDAKLAIISIVFDADVVIPVINCKDYMKVIRKGCSLDDGRLCALLGDEFNPKAPHGLNCSLRNKDEAFKYYKKSCDLGSNIGCGSYTSLDTYFAEIEARERDKTHKSDITIRRK